MERMYSGTFEVRDFLCEGEAVVDDAANTLLECRRSEIQQQPSRKFQEADVG